MKKYEVLQLISVISTIFMIMIMIIFGSIAKSEDDFSYILMKATDQQQYEQETENIQFASSIMCITGATWFVYQFAFRMYILSNWKCKKCGKRLPTKGYRFLSPNNDIKVCPYCGEEIKK